MTTNYAKMSTAILIKKLSTVKGEEKKAIQAVLTKRNKQIPEDKLKETKIKFVSKKGVDVEGLITSIITGTDGKPYYGVKQNDKLYYKQGGCFTIVK